ncbi:LysR substrate-binding domain-containing protein [Arthrobacter sp. JSM 101049]|uniref:LysR substrate-binding domain-containing protein n=1 Tax=Arthrobacter sp. JSM 101049 TaxID=929097 RepID=UPI00356AD899
METRHLRYFVAVAEERHFGRAAARLHMAQPPLSQQIKQLEEQLGTPLLTRTTRRVDLTPAGEMFLGRARTLLAELEQLAQDVRTVGEGATGVLRVGFTGTATYRLMPGIVASARERMPGLQLNVQGEMLTPEMEEALVEGRLDVAVLRPPVRSDAVELKFLEQDRLSVALPENHRLAARAELDLSDLADEPFICYPATSAVNLIFHEACRRVGFVPRVVQVARETSTLLTFVDAGLGVALLPTTARLPSSQRITFRPLRHAPAVDLALAWKTGNDAPLLRNFLEVCTPPPPPEGNAP